MSSADRPLEIDFANSWAVQKLADFLTGISASDDEIQVFEAAVELAAEALDAELGALSVNGRLMATFGALCTAELGEQLFAALAGGPAVEMAGVGPCVTAQYRLDGAEGALIIARREREPFTPGEHVLLRSMTRALSMALKSLRLLTRTREQEHKFSTVVRSSLDCIISIDAKGAITEWNPAAEATFGFKRSEAMGQPMAEFVVPERLRDAHHAGFERFLTTGEGPIIDQRIEAVAVRRDGTEFPVELAVTVVDGPEPQFTAYLRDISDRVAATAHLSETTQRLSALVDSLNAAVLVETEDRRVGLVNSRFCDVFRCSMAPSELVGVECATAAQRAGAQFADPAEFTERTNQIFAEGKRVFDDVVEFADGRIFERDHIPIVEDGATHGRLWVYRDITAKIAVEQDLAEARDNALAASRLKSSFLATMSHEIRTPMNGVVGLVDLLSSSPLNTQQKDLVRMLNTSAEHLIGVIDDILDFSRIEAGELKTESIPFIPAVAINDVVALFAARAQQAGVELKASIAPELSGVFLSDPGRIRQVLQNLVGNALKFTSNGSVDVRAVVQPGIAGEGRQLRLSVADTGIGMSAEVCARLFEPFVQADASTSRLYGGSGLGLSICHRLAQLLGGSISVVSKPGSGSTFTVILPLASAEATELEAGPGSGSGDGVEQAAVSRRILVVEDNPINQAVVRMQLERLGHEVVVVDGGLPALEVLEGGLAVDVVLMDCQMPGMDGFDATMRIRELGGEVGKTPIVAMTANALREDRVACLAAGMDDYLAKPLRTEDLAATLERWFVAGRSGTSGGTVTLVEALPLVDRSTLDQLVSDLGGDESVLGEFTEMFVGELPVRLQAISERLSEDDRHGTRQAAHALRSPSRALGLLRLDKVCERMERAAMDGGMDDARQLEAELVAAAEASVAELRRHAAVAV